MNLRAALWLLLSLGLAPAAAQDLITQRAVFEDLRADMTLEQAKLARFLPSKKMISRGYTRSALWVRLKVEAPADAAALTLNLIPMALDDVMLYSPQARGDYQASRLQQRASLIDAPQDGQYYYLRIKTSGPMMVLPTMLTVEQARKDDIARAILTGAVLASFAPIMLGLLLLIALRREMLHVVFFLHLAISLSVFITGAGYMADYVEPSIRFDNGNVHRFLVIANILTGFLFLRVLLARFGLPAWGKSLFALFFICYTPLLVLFFIHDKQLVQSISTTMAVLTSACCLLLTAAIFYRTKSATWPIATLIAGFMLLAIKTFLVLHGILLIDAWPIQMITFRVLFFPVIFGAILWLIDREKQEAIQSSMANQMVLRQLAEHEKERGEISQRFMTMLMHELKTPLAIIQLAATSLGRHLPSSSSDLARVSNINRSVDDLNALIEHCVQADQIEHSPPLVYKQAFSLRRLTDDLLQNVDAARVRLQAPGSCTLESDYQTLRIILLNLLSNALKYSAPDSLIAFDIEHAVERDKKGLNFLVSNYPGAAGMPDPERVFERYYRSSGAHRCVGAGLGLWLAQTMARQLGSELHFAVIGETGHVQVCFHFRLERA